MSSPSPAPIFTNPNAPTERELGEMRAACGRMMDLEKNVMRGLSDLKSGTRIPGIKGNNSDAHRLGAITEDPLGEILLGISKHKDLIEGLSKTGSIWSDAIGATLAQYQAFLVESAKKVRNLYETNLAWKGRADGVAKNMDSIAAILGRLTAVALLGAPNPGIVSPPSTIGKAPPRGGEVKIGSASQEAPLAQAHRELSEAKRELQERIEDVKRLAREADLAGTRISELKTERQQITSALQTAESARIDLRQDLESQLTSLRDALRKKEASLQTANEAIAKLDDTVLTLEEKVTQLEGELEAEKRKRIDLASAKESLNNEIATHEHEIQKVKEALDLAQKDHEQAIAKLKLEQEALLKDEKEKFESEAHNWHRKWKHSIDPNLSLARALRKLELELEARGGLPSAETDAALLAQCTLEIRKLGELTEDLALQDENADLTQSVRKLTDVAFGGIRWLGVVHASPEGLSAAQANIAACDDAQRAFREWLSNRFGLQEIVVIPRHTQFDPEKHDSRGKEIAPTTGLEGKISYIMKPGFIQHNRVIQKAKVTIFAAKRSTAVGSETGALDTFF